MVDGAKDRGCLQDDQRLIDGETPDDRSLQRSHTPGDLTPAGRRGPTTLRRDGGPFVSTRRQAEHAAVGYGSAGPTDPQPFRILHRSSSQARS